MEFICFYRVKKFTQSSFRSLELPSRGNIFPIYASIDVDGNWNVVLVTDCREFRRERVRRCLADQKLPTPTQACVYRYSSREIPFS